MLYFLIIVRKACLLLPKYKPVHSLTKRQGSNLLMHRKGLFWIMHPKERQKSDREVFDPPLSLFSLKIQVREQGVGVLVGAAHNFQRDVAGGFFQCVNIIFGNIVAIFIVADL